METKRTIIEENTPASSPHVVQTTKTVTDPNLHTQVIEDNEVTVQASPLSDPHTRQTRVIREPLVKTEHPQKVFEAKKTIFRFNQVVWYILTVIEVLLGFRLTLKAMGANTFSGFASLIYTLSYPFAHPFTGIISPSINGASLIEWSSMFAAAFYLILALGIIHLLQLIRPVTPEDVEENV